MSLVAGDDQVGPSGNCGCKNPVVCSVGGQTDDRQVIENDRPRINVPDQRPCFVGVDESP